MSDPIWVRPKSCHLDGLIGTSDDLADDEHVGGSNGATHSPCDVQFKFILS